MIARLTTTERQIGPWLAGLVMLMGAALGIARRSDVLGYHGLLITVFGAIVVIALLRNLDAPEPDESRLSEYYDDPIRFGIVLTMVWAIFSMFIGVWVAALLAWPELTFDAGWASFGRLRPAHTTGVIFCFGGNALITTALHMVQRTSRARLPDQVSPWFVLLGYNLFCLLAVSGYLLGITQSKEYAEPEWYADIWLVVVWVAFFALYIRTLARRKEPHIYVAS